MRWASRFCLVLIVSLVVAGCPVDDDDDSVSDDDTSYDDVGDDDTGDDDSSDDDSGDDDTATAGPCPDGSWGLIDDPEHAIHVAAKLGNDAGTGTELDPLETFEAALELSRQEGQLKRIAIWPGNHASGSPILSSQDDGLTIEGCGANAGLEVFPEPNLPTFRIDGAQGVRLAGLYLFGGTDAITIGGVADVELENITVYFPSCRALVVTGSGTTVYAEDVAVLSGQECDSGAGAGFYINGATATIVDSRVWDTRGAGFVGIAADLVVRGCNHSMVASAVTHASRGVHLEQLSTAVIEDSRFAGTKDAGVFSMDSLSLEVRGCTIEDTMAVDIPGGTSGDGIVVTHSGGNPDPGDYPAILEGNEIVDSARTGIIVDGVSAEIEGTVTTDGIYSQNGAITSGSDPATEPVTPYPIDRTPLPF
jgi:Right handed beta helix region